MVYQRVRTNSLPVRKQRVKIGNEHSEWLDISKNVPQSSILGPLIFNIFINDILYFIQDGNLFNYADDNCVTMHHKELTTLQGILQNEAKLTHWGRVTHICVGEQTIIGSDNGLSPGRRQAIIWTNAGILSTGPLGTNFSEILIEINTFSFKCRLENGGHLASASMS